MYIFKFEDFQQIQYEKIKQIRTRLELSQEDVAKKLGLSLAEYMDIECGQQRITPELLSNLKTALNLHRVPITSDEIAEFEASLWNWRDMINGWLVDSAIEAQPYLEHSAYLSCDPDLFDIYTLISVGFYRLVRNEKAASAAMLTLENNLFRLSRANEIRFLVMRGTGAISKYDHRSAYSDLIEAYKLDEGYNIANYGLYHHLAICFTKFGFAYMAINFIMKAREKAKNDKNYETLLHHTNILLATNYASIGMFNESLDIINTCSTFEKANYIHQPTMIYIHYAQAHIFYGMHKYDLALKYCNSAIERMAHKDTNYLTFLFLKTKICSMQGNLAEFLISLNEGLISSQNNSIFSIKFNAIKHFATLHEYQSLDYIAEVAIPNMLYEMRYDFAIECFDRLSEHYTRTKQYELSNKYALLARQYTQKLFMGDLS